MSASKFMKTTVYGRMILLQLITIEMLLAVVINVFDFTYKNN